MIVNDFRLSKTLGDKICFVPFDGTICSMFNFEHPFAINRSLAKGQSGESLGVVGSKTIKFRRHGLAPMRISCFCKRRRLQTSTGKQEPTIFSLYEFVPTKQLTPSIKNQSLTLPPPTRWGGVWPMDRLSQ